MKSTRFSRQFCPNCFVCGSYLYRREGDRVRGAGLEKRVNPSHAVRSMPCPAPLPARTPPCGGFFRPFLPPTAPKPAVFAPPPRCFPGKTPPEAAVSAPQPPGFPGFRPALRPGCRPKRARCAPFPGKPARFCPGSPVFPALRPHLARDPARFAPEGTPRTTEARPENAPPPGVPSPLGLPPRPALPLRRGEACTPQGGLNLWERFSGDRRPVAHEFSRNSSPGGLHKNRVTVNKLQGVGDRPYPAYASTLWQVGQLIPTEEHKMQAGFMLCGYFRLWWAIAHYKTIFRFGKIEIR